jgi:hypothetical protein
MSLPYGLRWQPSVATIPSNSSLPSHDWRRIALLGHCEPLREYDTTGTPDKQTLRHTYIRLPPPGLVPH